MAAIAAVGISYGQTTFIFVDTYEYFREKIDYRNLKPKELTYDVLTLIVLILYIVTQLVDSMQQEADYVMDGFVLFTLALIWIT